MSVSQKVSFTVRRPSPLSRAASSGPESDSSSFKVPNLPRHLALSSDSAAPNSPLARNESPHTNGYYDSSDEDDEIQDELVTGFDKFGVQRCVTPFQLDYSHLNSQKSNWATLRSLGCMEIGRRKTTSH